MKRSLIISRIKKWFSRNLPLVLFILTLTATIWGTWFTHRIAVQENQEKFDALKERISGTIRTRFNFYTNTLRQTKAFFMQDNNISNENFKTYVHNIGLVERYPGMTAIGYVEYVPSEKLVNFISTQRLQGQKDYDIWPIEKNRDFYTPVKFIEPFFKGVRELRGFDMVSDPQRRAAMVKSAAEGKATITEEVYIFDAEDTSNPQGFNIFIPVYNAVLKPSTTKERIAKTQGYVFGIFNSARIFDIIMRENQLFQQNASVTVLLEDGNDRPTKVYDTKHLIGANRNSKSPAYEDTVKINVANKNWHIHIASLRGFEGQLSNNTRWFVLAFGSILAFMFLFFTRNILKSKLTLEESEKTHRKLAQSNWMLVEAGRTLGSGLDTSTLLYRFANYFTQNFSDSCIIYIKDSDNPKELKLLVSTFREKSTGSREAMENFTKAKHVINYVFQEGRFLYQESSRDLGEKAFVALPMSVRGEIFGVINLIYNNPKKLNQEDLKLLQQAVQVASSSIENSLLYKEAQVASRLKDEFLATVSHELRTPLMVILGYSKLLLKKDLDPDVKKNIKAISAAAETQSSLIEDLLDVSAIISGKVKFKPQAVQIPEVVNSAIENLALTAKTKNLKIDCHIDKEAQVLGEKVRLQQIVWNLLSNSIKFTPPGGKIEVRVEARDNKCLITIKDNGKGIDPDFLPHVFEKFRQEEKTSTRSKGGLGLGLSIVASLVELHGGTIQVVSEGKNKGSSFIVSLPLMSAQKTIEVKSTMDSDHTLKEVRALVLDDDNNAMDLISRILEGYDAEVFPARNVAEALSIMKEKQPNVVISDLAMPERDGYDFIREVREKEKSTGDHIPVVVLTAFTGEKNRQEALESGFDSFLSKPVEPDHLVAAVQKVIHPPHSTLQ